MPREKGPEWDYVTLIQPEGTDGVRQATLLVISCCGVAKCTAAEDKLEPVKKVMQQLEQDSRNREQQEAQGRQLHRATSAAAAAPAKKQKTIAGCVSRPP
eukprot:1161659-Pelagomonas_calceolata.AAC.22